MHVRIQSANSFFAKFINFTVQSFDLFSLLVKLTHEPAKHRKNLCLSLLAFEAFFFDLVDYFNHFLLGNIWHYLFLLNFFWADSFSPGWCLLLLFHDFFLISFPGPHFGFLRIDDHCLRLIFLMSCFLNHLGEISVLITYFSLVFINFVAARQFHQLCVLSILPELLNLFVFSIEFLDPAKHLFDQLCFFCAVFHVQQFHILLQFALILSDIRFEMLPWPHGLLDLLKIQAFTFL